MSHLTALPGDLYPEARHPGLAFDSGGATSIRVRRTAWLASAVLGFACFMLVVVLLAALWAERGRTPGPAEPAPAASRSEPPGPHWIEITRPLAAFDLAGGPFARLPMHLEARRSTDGAARQDVLTYGAPQPGEAFVRLLFDRHEPRPVDNTTLFVDAARLAGSAGLAVLRSTLASPQPTRFGPFEVADVTIGRPGGSAPCLAFRRSADILTIVGLMCVEGAKAVDQASLACSLDKIDLVVAGDAALRELFNGAERQRGVGCTDARAARGSTDPLRPISDDLRGTLAGGQGPGRQLSRPR